MVQQSNARKMKSLLVDKHHWELLSNYLADEKNRLVKLIIRCSNEELKELQGQIKALENIENLKHQLKQEEGNRQLPFTYFTTSTL